MFATRNESTLFSSVHFRSHYWTFFAVDIKSSFVGIVMVCGIWFVVYLNSKVMWVHQLVNVWLSRDGLNSSFLGQTFVTPTNIYWTKTTKHSHLERELRKMSQIIRVIYLSVCCPKIYVWNKSFRMGKSGRSSWSNKTRWSLKKWTDPTFSDKDFKK